MAIEEELLQFIHTEIEPYILSHNGMVQFVRFEDGIVYLQLTGSCSTCSASTITLSFHIERQIRKRFREVKKVSSVGA